jgi:outer membrane protein TolC
VSFIEGAEVRNEASAQRHVEAGDALAARADYLPRLELVGFAGYTAGDVDAFGRRGTLGYSVGPVIS